VTVTDPRPATASLCALHCERSQHNTLPTDGTAS
jgi:hypothetical protein